MFRRVLLKRLGVFRRGTDVWPGWWCPDCGDWIDDGDQKAAGDFTIHKWCS